MTVTETSSTARRYGEGRLFQRGQRWHIAYYINGREVREPAKTADRRKAERLLKMRLAQITTGIYEEPAWRRVRFEELADDLERDWARKAGHRSRLSPLKNLRAAFAGQFAVQVATTDGLEAYRRRRLDKDGASNSTENREIAVLRRMWNVALRSHPPKVKGPLPYLERLPEPPPREGYLEREQYRALRDALPDYLRLVLTAGYYTGMRLGEVLLLRWQDVNLARREITLPWGSTKNDDKRVIPLAGELYEMLRLERDRRDVEYPDCSWVFQHRGRRIQSFRKHWNNACVKAGLGAWTEQTSRRTGQEIRSYRGLIYHDLRRTAVTNMIELGIPDKTAMEISGHRTLEMLWRYKITRRTGLHAAMQKLADYLAQDTDKIRTIAAPGSSTSEGTARKPVN